MDRTPRLIVILGPTAGGKSELAVELAEQLGAPGLPRGGEIISADSMQVYRGMEVGTAKPSAELRRRAVHHLLDVVEPAERFTVADWLARAEAVIADCQRRGVWPIVVGGTNLYIKALLEGLFGGPAIDRQFRESLAKEPARELHRRLAEVDAAAAERIHPNDAKRLVRALEVFHVTGRPISAFQTQWGKQESGQVAKWPSGRGKAEESSAEDDLATRPLGDSATSSYRFNPILIGLDWPVEAINKRINARVREMFYPRQPGGETLIDETRRLEAAGVLGSQARLALGYQQVLDHLAGRCGLDEAFEKTKILTRRFARTQRTWLKRYLGVLWLPAEQMALEELTTAALARIKEAGDLGRISNVQ